MDALEARRKWDRSSQLFRDNEFERSLALLDELQPHFPGDSHIVRARAKCLAHLGRMPEAIGVCDEALGRRDDPAIRGLRTQLGALEPEIPEIHIGADSYSPDNLDMLASLDIDMDRPASVPHHTPEVSESRLWEFLPDFGEWPKARIFFALIAMMCAIFGLILGCVEPSARNFELAVSLGALAINCALLSWPFIYQLDAGVFLIECLTYLFTQIAIGLFFSSIAGDSEFGLWNLSGSTVAARLGVILITAMLVYVFLMIIGAIQILVFRIALWLWEEKGILFWLVMIFTTFSFIGVWIAAAINRYIAQKILDSLNE